MSIDDLRDKHILVISSVYPTTSDGNHGAFIRETVLQMRSLGINFKIFAPAYEGSQTHNLDNIEIYRFRYFFKRFENLVRDGAPTKLQKQPLYILVALSYILLGAWQLFWLCKKQKPDLLHVNWPFPHGLMAYPTSKLLGIPMLFSFHGAELLLAKKFSFVGAILRWQIPMARSVTANSSFTKALIQKLYSGAVTVIPYGLTIEPKKTVPRNPEEDMKLLFVGRLDERKGLRYLLEALPLVLSKYPVRLRIVGKGILEDEIKAQCKELKLEKVVDFLGFVSKEELANEYASCDIFVLPAIVDSKGDTEGLGIVMIEALAHEKPVIASAVGGIVDVIQSGVTGILVKEKDPQALFQAIVDLIADPVRAKELGHRGLKDIQVRFGWSHLVLLWQDVFTKALTQA
ncbi:glycosyltransferase family 4 protein [Pseudanabaena minima]|uniref:glycosyltransferase family 4 protein n=1 Tax=Pseudanabaena minima TaxID=890415 RepID=UPI003DA99F00